MVLGFFGHDFIDRNRHQVGAHVTAEIAVGDDADHMAVAIGDADAAKALRGHFHQRIGHLGAERLERHGVA